MKMIMIQTHVGFSKVQALDKLEVIPKGTQWLLKGRRREVKVFMSSFLSAPYAFKKPTLKERFQHV